MLGLFFCCAMCVSFYTGVVYGRNGTDMVEQTTQDTKEDKWKKYEKEMLEERQRIIDSTWEDMLRSIEEGK